MYRILSDKPYFLSMMYPLCINSDFIVCMYCLCSKTLKTFDLIEFISVQEKLQMLSSIVQIKILQLLKLLNSITCYFL